MSGIKKRYLHARTVVNKISAEKWQRLIADDDIKQLLSIFSDKQSTPISTASFDIVKTVTGFYLLPVCVRRDRNTFWDIKKDNELDVPELSATFSNQMARMKKWFPASGDESYTRSLLDLYITEAAENMPPTIKQLNFYGEVSLTQRNNNETLSGDADYTIAFGETQRPAPENITVIVEAKASGLTSRNALRQTFTYMAIVFNARKQAGKKNAGVFGVLSDSESFFYLRIDNEGQVWRSTTFDALVDQKVILSNLTYVLTAAQCSSPTTSAFSSTEQLVVSPSASIKNLSAFNLALSDATSVDEPAAGLNVTMKLRREEDDEESETDEGAD